MRPKPADNQNLPFSARLEQILNHNHPLFKLANAIEWFEFEEAFGKLYDPGQGRPAKPIRLMVGLHYLKHACDLSDEDVVARWVENPYWQYFCGFSHFEHELPIDSSLMPKWRQKVKAEGMELIGAFKVPSLRNVAETAPYMHLGQIPVLRGVLEHYDRAPVPLMGHSDLLPLKLSDREIDRLEAFLRTLSGPLDTPDRRLRPPE